MKQIFVAGAVVLALSGCASIFNGTTQSVTLSSAPDGATATVTNRAGLPVHSGPTPVTLQLSRGAGYFKAESYTVTFSKEGFVPKVVQLDARVSGWYIANILLGGAVGMLAVDPATGAMYTFPSTLAGALEPQAKTATSSAPGALTVVSTDTLTAEQMKQARPLAPAAPSTSATPVGGKAQ